MNRRSLRPARGVALLYTLIIVLFLLPVALEVMRRSVKEMTDSMVAKNLQSARDLSRSVAQEMMQLYSEDHYRNFFTTFTYSTDPNLNLRAGWGRLHAGYPIRRQDNNSIFFRAQGDYIPANPTLTRKKNLSGVITSTNDLWRFGVVILEDFAPTPVDSPGDDFFGTIYCQGHLNLSNIGFNLNDENGFGAILASTVTAPPALSVNKMRIKGMNSWVFTRKNQFINKLGVQWWSFPPRVVEDLPTFRPHPIWPEEFSVRATTTIFAANEGDTFEFNFSEVTATIPPKQTLRWRKSGAAAWTSFVFPSTFTPVVVVGVGMNIAVDNGNASAIKRGVVARVPLTLASLNGPNTGLGGNIAFLENSVYPISVAGTPNKNRCFGAVAQGDIVLETTNNTQTLHGLFYADSGRVFIRNRGSAANDLNVKGTIIGRPLRDPLSSFDTDLHVLSQPEFEYYLPPNFPRNPRLVLYKPES